MICPICGYDYPIKISDTEYDCECCDYIFDITESEDYEEDVDVVTVEYDEDEDYDEFVIYDEDGS